MIFFEEIKNEDALEKLTDSKVINHYKKKAAYLC